MFKNFSNFLLWELYPSMVNDSAGRERNNFQQLIKVDWTKKFISTTWPGRVVGSIFVLEGQRINFKKAKQKKKSKDSGH